MSSIVNGIGTPSSLYQVFPARHPLLGLGREHPVSQALPRSHNLLFSICSRMSLRYLRTVLSKRKYLNAVSIKYKSDMLGAS
ncbi:hypothetical protein A1Q1_01433 [Trichosporon asahii var. asahii CBS 2479]|uniref:Uncharacterized protein n=1 Tax=Trichosporon asahii var. asahii (strain ATCC 90039 / CBS 2479 / JCM 2466 / KCTC 7840 / NBRC 103889/ NCYC 2677 / UAMH 7654) TaxID=1186058 RepID=J6EY23_TRIAS|nr:hypothetical protein A1Q1_01433 [Trichosporon asahii var. asahii CBS 2479]EJT49529.1 hypothetical protein A1Q1_01433 [Trichosporon asahii var. asahii CBS 2479]